MDLDQPTFTRHVRDALDHFYEPAYLYASPLADLLLPEPTMDAAAALRELLRSAIERLRPPSSVPYGSSEWNSYRILWDRCIQRRSWYLIGEDLALGRSSVYKYMHQAVEALGTMLWKQSQAVIAARAPAITRQVPRIEVGSLDEQAATEAVRMAQAWPRGPVRVQTLIDDLRVLVAPLAEMRQIKVAFAVPEALAPLLGDVAVLHQIMVDIMITAIEHSRSGMLTLSVESQEGEMIFRLGELPLDSDRCGLLDQMAVGQQLLTSYGGRTWFDEGQQGMEVCFALPAGSLPMILVADDDPDTLVLYQRFLRDAGYALRVVRNGAELSDSLAKERPDLIILDVLMPQEDGWMVLQRLKTLPETAGIPVLVYSVLGQPSLALALGAAAVLRKPVQEADLVSAVEKALAPLDLT